MFILAHLDIIGLALVVAFPFYFINRYLVKRFKPRDSLNQAARYFIVVLLMASIYSAAAIYMFKILGIVFK